MNVCKDDASILIIYTGGTIGMIENPETGSLEAFNFEHLEEHVPELKNLGYKISSIQFDPPMDSSEMGPDSWMKIVHVIAEHYHDYDACRSAWDRYDGLYRSALSLYAGKSE